MDWLGRMAGKFFLNRKEDLDKNLKHELFLGNLKKILKIHSQNIKNAYNLYY